MLENKQVRRSFFSVLFMPYNKSFIDQASSVKMAGYRPRSLFTFLWTSTSSRSIKTWKENSANIQPSWPRGWSIIYTYFTTIDSLGLKTTIFTQNFNELIGFPTNQLAFRHLINNLVVCVTNFVAQAVRTFCVRCRIDRLQKWRSRKMFYCLCAN